MNIVQTLRIALRVFLKNRISSFVNVSALTIGLSAFVVIMLYIEHELSFDKFHSRHQDIYRVVKDFVSPDGAAVPDATTVPALTKAIETSLPEVEVVTRFVPNRGRLYLLKYEDKVFYETEVIRADYKFFDVFNFPFIAGDQQTALKDVHSVVITRSISKKYFGDANPIGQLIKMNVNNGTDYKVTGVVEDVPANSHFSFDIIIPFESRRDPDTNWQFSAFYTYVRLQPGTDVAAFESQVRELVHTNQPQSIDRYYVQPLDDIHLQSHLKWELAPNGDIMYVRILGLIAVFIIVIACINYTNLTTAQSSMRAKEIGVRKTIGAVRTQVAAQFLAESILMVLVAFLFTVIIVSAVLPVLTPLTNIDLSPLLFNGKLMWWLVPGLLVVAFLAGLYPAIYLSAFKPLQVLRSNFSHVGGGSNLRRALVIFQFVMSSGLIAGTLIVSSQLSFMREKDLGFTSDHVLIVPNVRGGIGNDSQEPWDEAVRQIPAVRNISRADGILGSTNAVNGIGVQSTNTRISLNFIRIDHDFIPTLEIPVIEGRNFSKDFVSDSAAIILNQRAVEQLGLKEPVIGQLVDWDDEAGKSHPVRVVGVVRDFHFTDLHSAIMPFGFILEVGNGSNFFIKVENDNLGKTIQAIGQVWNERNPGKPFEYSFQGDYNARYQINDQRFESLFFIFTGVAILIACLGLFGLTAFLAASRTKEVGLRKILGASVTNILLLVSREYIIVIAIALVVATPLAWYLMDAWLNGFAYRIDISWMTFALTGVITLLFAMITVAFHAIKVSTRNPVESLRAE